MHQRAFTPQGRLWWAALGAERLSAEEPPDTYKRLEEQSRHAESANLTVVERDIPRTFPERPEYTAGDAPHRLRRVLRAYCVRNTYCQGMSFVAALLLQHMPEREGFWALAALAERFLPEGYFSEDLRGVYMDQHVAFTVFLPHRLPRLAAHLASLDFPLTLIGIRWFLCVFACDLSEQSTCRLWDFVFAHGAHVVFGLTLALLAAQEEALLELHDVHDLFVHFRALGDQDIGWERLLELARSFPSEADVAVARARYQKQKRQQHEEEEARRRQQQEARRAAAAVRVQAAARGRRARRTAAAAAAAADGPARPALASAAAREAAPPPPPAAAPPTSPAAWPSPAPAAPAATPTAASAASTPAAPTSVPVRGPPTGRGASPPTAVSGRAEPASSAIEGTDGQQGGGGGGGGRASAGGGGGGCGGPPLFVAALAGRSAEAPRESMGKAATRELERARKLERLAERAVWAAAEDLSELHAALGPVHTPGLRLELLPLLPPLPLPLPTPARGGDEAEGAEEEGSEAAQQQGAARSWAWGERMMTALGLGRGREDSTPVEEPG